MQDIFEQLAQFDVPPAPAQLEHEVHQRLNKSLLILHLCDLLLRGLPWAMLHFGRALVGLTVLTLTGKYGDEGPSNRREKIV